jgi:invasion protein IalB
MQTIRSHIAGAALALIALGAGTPAVAQAPQGTALAAPADGSVDRIGDWELVCAAAQLNRLRAPAVWCRTSWSTVGRLHFW